MMQEVQLGAVGHIIELTVKKKAEDGTISVRDISGQTALSIYAEPKIASAKTFTAALTTDGTDGKMQYTTTASSDLDESGEWKIQGLVTEGASPITKTAITKILVKDNLV